MDRLIEMIQKINLPFAYHHFQEGESVNPPFLVYYLPTRKDLIADGENYYPLHEVHIEIYTDKKELAIEEKIEQIFKEYGICYGKQEIWIASEKLFEVLYTFTMEVNNGK